MLLFRNIWGYLFIICPGSKAKGLIYDVGVKSQEDYKKYRKKTLQDLVWRQGDYVSSFHHFICNIDLVEKYWIILILCKYFVGIHT